MQLVQQLWTYIVHNEQMSYFCTVSYLLTLDT